MINKNGKRIRVEPVAMTVESVVANQMVRRRSSPSDSSSSLISSCLSTTEEMKEEVSSSWNEEPHVLVLAGCRRCIMYVLVLQERLRCPKCKCNNLIQF
ncbi:hypothetical protein Bca52824_007828 [Brassica carinata]|uniref:GIR1-like zinc ribbon domain-containing protein n=1 Tax=Brassica carinata TaxID=52824 RepID=A0A8X7W9Q4_BRACI|nr:hypothetical protein Bca52824_007828 [Brassica carinata]